MLPQEDKNLTLKRELIEGTIDTVATLGLENTTTNAICTTCKINVAYIYRFFADKEDLIAKAFGFVDEQFLQQILDNYTVLNYESIENHAAVYCSKNVGTTLWHIPKTSPFIPVTIIPFRFKSMRIRNI